MLKMLTRILLLVASVAHIGSVQAQSAKSAKHFLQQVYAPYYRGNAPNPAKERASRLFDSDLLSLIQKDQKMAKDEEGVLNFDPICDCQDYESIKVQSINVSRRSKFSAYANVVFRNGFIRKALRYDLTYQDAQWKISNIQHDRAESLKDLLGRANRGL